MKAPPAGATDVDWLPTAPFGAVQAVLVSAFGRTIAQIQPGPNFAFQTKALGSTLPVTRPPLKTDANEETEFNLIVRIPFRFGTGPEGESTFLPAGAGDVRVELFWGSLAALLTDATGWSFSALSAQLFAGYSDPARRPFGYTGTLVLGTRTEPLALPTTTVTLHPLGPLWWVGLALFDADDKPVDALTFLLATAGGRIIAKLPGGALNAIPRLASARAWAEEFKETFEGCYLLNVAPYGDPRRLLAVPPGGGVTLELTLDPGLASVRAVLGSAVVVMLPL